MRQQDGGNDTADVEENLRRQQNARQEYAELELPRVEAVEHPAFNRRREKLGATDPDQQDGCHHRDDDRERLLRVVLALLGQKTGIN